MQKRIAILFTILLCLLFTACSSRETSYETDSLLIKEDGSIKEYINEEFAEDTYDAEKLQEMLNSETEQYNAKNGVDSIKIGKFEVADNYAKIMIQYKRAADYEEFNQIPLYCGTVASALQEGYTITLDAVDAVEGSRVTAQSICNDRDRKICIIGFKYDIYVDGTILFYSDGMTLVDDNHVSMENVDTGYIVYE